jgi:hypothetical protein
MRGLPNLIAVSRQTDVVNDAITFGNVGYDDKGGIYYYTGRRITGINRPIRIKISYDDSYGTLYYSKNYPAFPPGEDFVDEIDPLSLGFISLNTTETITANPGDYLYFGVEKIQAGNQFAVLTNFLNNDSLISYIDLV